ncbi:hypothetical protein PM082_006994 [Marasmius tenuissimus]|nr:hypothetical protein PM082_006994 [Marasmius tenuissimus]
MIPIVTYANVPSDHLPASRRSNSVASRLHQAIGADVPVGVVAGPCVIGYLLNWGLFGVLCAQVFLYYLAFPRDRRSVKTLVYSLLVLDFVQIVVVTNDIFIKYSLEFTNVQGLWAMRHAWFSIPMMSAINATAVQLFFAHRITMLSESKSLGLLVAIMAITAGTGGITTGVQAKIIDNFAEIATKARAALTIWLTVSGACDLAIAVCMTVILYKKKPCLNPESETNDVVTKIIRLVVHSQVHIRSHLQALAPTEPNSSL